MEASLPPPKFSPFCWNLKWPFLVPLQNPKPKTPNPCDFDTPFLFKTFRTLSSLAINFLHSASQHLDLKPHRINGQISVQKIQKNGRKTSSSDEQGEAEQRALALALASGKEAVVIEFYSPKCRLCNSLLDLILELEAKNSDWLTIVMADAENSKWLPETQMLGQFKAKLLRDATHSSFCTTTSNMFHALCSWIDMEKLSPRHGSQLVGSM